jgi:hypothetical protein
MITGAHAILDRDDADATRAALAKVLSTPSAAAGCSSPCRRPRSPSTRPTRVAGPSCTS